MEIALGLTESLNTQTPLYISPVTFKFGIVFEFRDFHINVYFRRESILDVLFKAFD
jgi:hypothetical protein